MKMSRKSVLAGLAMLMLAGAVLGQGFRRGGGRRFGGFGGGGRGGGWIQTEGGVPVDENAVRTAREIASHSTGSPEWTNSPGFEKDVFTFVRIIRDHDSAPGYHGGSWITDFPDSDLNFSFRLQQITSIRTDPNGRVLRLTDPDLFHYPWIYMVEPGTLMLRDEEVPILRRYLLSGGVLMADDFWGGMEWDNFARQMKRVFPEREFEELPMEHPIFHCVFDIKGPKNSLQTPAQPEAVRRHSTEFTWETDHVNSDGSPADTREMHVRAVHDDKGRIMIIATHNCDNGDSWEREGESEWFFHEFSEKRGYPLGVNIVFYLMTH